MKSLLSLIAIFLMMLFGSWALLIGFADQTVTPLEIGVARAKQAMGMYHGQR